MDRLDECMRVDNIVVEKYFGETAKFPKEKRNVANAILVADIDTALTKAEDVDAAMADICGMFSEDFRQTGKNLVLEAYEAARVRRDFASAFSEARRGSELSDRLGYALSKKDLKELAKLHKKNRFRKKIEDLLNNVNFHYEARCFRNGNYDEFLKEEDA